VIDREMSGRRLEVLRRHFQSEVDHDWETCLGTFNGHPRYEIMATGQVHDGDDAVLAYHRGQRVAFPDQRHDNARFHVADDETIIADRPDRARHRTRASAKSVGRNRREAAMSA
jgi:hypothetical protein